MWNVIVASTNPVKINTTKQGFSKMFPSQQIDYSGIKAKSGVPDQPMSEEETIYGAATRAKNVLSLAPSADYAVGIEGGLALRDGNMEAFAWVVIISKEGKYGKGRTGSFFIPNKVAELIKGGMELGDADDLVFARTNSKRSNGAVGILTEDVLTRTTFYEPAVILALIPFKNPKLY